MKLTRQAIDIHREYNICFFCFVFFKSLGQFCGQQMNSLLKTNESICRIDYDRKKENVLFAMNAAVELMGLNAGRHSRCNPLLSPTFT